MTYRVVPPPVLTRLNGDSRGVVIAVTALVALLAVTSFSVGVPGLLTVASWAGLTGLLAIGVPFVIDGGIAVMTLAAVVKRARRESTRFVLSALGVLTGLSTAAQAAHVLIPAWGQLTAEHYVGAGVASLAPVMLYTSTHVLLDLAFAPPAKKGRRTGSTSRSTQVRPVRSGEPPKRTSEPIRVEQPPVHVNPAGRSAGRVTEPGRAAHGEPGEPRDELTELVQARRAEGATDAQLAVELKQHGLTNARVAELLGVSVSTVKRLRAQADQAAHEEEGVAA